MMMMTMMMMRMVMMAMIVTWGVQLLEEKEEAREEEEEEEEEEGSHCEGASVKRVTLQTCCPACPAMYAWQHLSSHVFSVLLAFQSSLLGGFIHNVQSPLLQEITLRHPGNLSIS